MAPLRGSIMSLNSNILLCRSYSKWNNNIMGILNQIKISGHKASFSIVILMSDDNGDSGLARSGFSLICQIVNKYTGKGKWLGELNVQGVSVNSLDLILNLDVKSLLFEEEGEYEILVYLKNTGMCIAHTPLRVFF